MVKGKKEVYPQMVTRWWWDLRRQFRRTLPGNITDSYLASVLNIGASSAKSVVIPGLKLLGIINQDGTINDGRARAWRDDGQYSQVCQAIVKELYPQELLDAFPEPSEDDRRSIEQWFARQTGVGDRAARAMTAFYLMLSEADPTKASEQKKVGPKRAMKEVKRETRVTPTVKPTPETIEGKRPAVEADELSIPSVNINVQVHISSDASVAQIDQIFSSMAKHLNIGRKTSNE